MYGASVSTTLQFNACPPVCSLILVPFRGSKGSKFWFLLLTPRLLDWRTNTVRNQLEGPHARIERRRKGDGEPNSILMTYALV